MKKIITLILIVFLLPLSLTALDFGLILDQNASLGGAGDAAFEYQADFIPRLSGVLGDSSNRVFKGNFIVTAGISAGTDEPYFIPELLRTELTWRFGSAKVTAGRMQYTAPFAAVAGGLFDGFQFEYDTEIGAFNAGAWYTGLLYKKRANIIMTAEDTQSWYAAVDYGSFAATYFASRRMVMSLGWEHPALAELVMTEAAFIAQFDLNGRDDYLHSQYIALKAGVPINQFMFELGGVLEFVQNDAGNKLALAGELAAFWTLPTPFTSRLSFTGYFSSADTGDGSVAAFTPITGKTYGSILEAKPSGISALSLDYTARLHKTLSAGFTATYFIRSDLVTYAGYPLDGENSDGYLLGNEFFARLVWSPLSDLQINLGGGVFLPGMGNAAPDRAPQWRIKLAAIAALY